MKWKFQSKVLLHPRGVIGEPLIETLLGVLDIVNTTGSDRDPTDGVSMKSRKCACEVGRAACVLVRRPSRSVMQGAMNFIHAIDPLHDVDLPPAAHPRRTVGGEHPKCRPQSCTIAGTLIEASMRPYVNSPFPKVRMRAEVYWFPCS